MVGARTCEPLVKISMRAAGRGCIGRGTRLIVVAEIVSPHPRYEDHGHNGSSILPADTLFTSMDPCG